MEWGKTSALLQTGYKFCPVALNTLGRTALDMGLLYNRLRVSFHSSSL